MPFIKNLIHKYQLSGLYKSGKISYSLEGEDLILSRYFEGEKSGFYVEVGAYHPVRFSNSYLFYKKGWHGINIDARPGSMKLFNRIRPRDINIEAAISDEMEELTYYMFNEPALNSFDKTLSETRKSENFKLISTMKLKTQLLSDVLEKNISDSRINFMSIDVEGFDLKVLKSNDWKKFRPELILIEVIDFNINTLIESPINKWLQSVGYEFWAKTLTAMFYKKIS